MSERDVEVPWAIERAIGPVLDVGCAESGYQHALDGPVDGIDLRPVDNPDLRHFYLGDIRDFEFSAPYRTVLAISTLEHVGLACKAYGTKADDEEGGDRAALLGCVRAAGEDGIVLVSVPFGVARDYSWFRQYNQERLKRFCDGLNAEWVVHMAPLWKQCEPYEAEFFEYNHAHASANAVALITIGETVVAPKDYATVGVMKKSVTTIKETQLDRDRAAYQRLRKQGLQPPRIDGCAKLEKEAVTRDEIVMGVVRPDISEADRKRVAKERRDAFDRAREITE